MFHSASLLWIKHIHWVNLCSGSAQRHQPTPRSRQRHWLYASSRDFFTCPHSTSLLKNNVSIAFPPLGLMYSHVMDFRSPFKHLLMKSVRSIGKDALLQEAVACKAQNGSSGYAWKLNLGRVDKRVNLKFGIWYQQLGRPFHWHRCFIELTTASLEWNEWMTWNGIEWTGLKWSEGRNDLTTTWMIELVEQKKDSITEWTHWPVAGSSLGCFSDVFSEHSEPFSEVVVLLWAKYAFSIFQLQILWLLVSSLFLPCLFLEPPLLSATSSSSGARLCGPVRVSSNLSAPAPVSPAFPTTPRARLEPQNLQKHLSVTLRLMLSMLSVVYSYVILCQLPNCSGLCSPGGWIGQLLNLNWKAANWHLSVTPRIARSTSFDDLMVFGDIQNHSKIWCGWNGSIAFCQFQLAV